MSHVGLRYTSEVSSWILKNTKSEYFNPPKVRKHRAISVPGVSDSAKQTFFKIFQKYLKNQQNFKHTMFETNRDSKETALKWRNQISFENADRIEKVCKNEMTLLNYL